MILWTYAKVRCLLLEYLGRGVDWSQGKEDRQMSSFSRKEKKKKTGIQPQQRPVKFQTSTLDVSNIDDISLKLL